MAVAGSEIIFLGSGSSTGVPTPICVLQPSDPRCSVCHKALAAPPETNKNYRCNPSLMIKYLAAPPPGEGLQSGAGGAQPRFRYIQIDCGKCFREQVLRWYVRRNIPRMDALILSHEHADAIFGLDDIRGLQPGPGTAAERIPVFVTPHTMDSVMEKFAYLVSPEQRLSYSKDKEGCAKGATEDIGCECTQIPSPAPAQGTWDKGRGKGEVSSGGCTSNPSTTNEQDPPGSARNLDSMEGSDAADSLGPTSAASGDGIHTSQQLSTSPAKISAGESVCLDSNSVLPVKDAKPAVYRRVTLLNWKLISPSIDRPFAVEGLTFVPLPVFHGEDYISLGFEFGTRDRVVYISDVSRIPEGTMQYLERRRASLGRPAILVIDALNYDRPHETHFFFPETLDAVRSLQPKRAFLIGMTHQFDHDAVNAELALWSEREGIDVQLSWDGLSLPVTL